MPRQDPPAEPTKSDEDFIEHSEEDVNRAGAVEDANPDYNPSMDTNDGTDGDDEAEWEDDETKSVSRAERKAGSRVRETSSRKGKSRSVVPEEGGS